MFDRIAAWLRLALLLLLGVVGTAAGQSAEPLWVEAQTWKCPTGQPLSMCEHTHAGGFLPIFTPVSGAVPLPFDFLLHNVSGTLDLVKYTGGEDRVNLAGIPGSTTPKLSRVYVYDTLALPDGWTSWQMNRTRVRGTDGVLWHVRLIVGLDVVNGKPRSAETIPALRSAAWPDDDRGYSNWTVPGVHVQALRVEKAGAWTLQATCGSSHAGDTRDVTVALDPAVHMGNFGQIILTQAAVPKRPLTIVVPATDAGDHKLMLRCADTGRFPGFDIVGVLVLGFTSAGGL